MCGAAGETGREDSADGSESRKAVFGFSTTIVEIVATGNSADRDELGAGLSPDGVWTQLPLFFKFPPPGDFCFSSGWSGERG